MKSFFCKNSEVGGIGGRNEEGRRMNFTGYAALLSFRLLFRGGKGMVGEKRFIHFPISSCHVSKNHVFFPTLVFVFIFFYFLSYNN